MEDRETAKTPEKETQGGETSGGLFNSLLGGDATQRAWGLWESVKSNPTIQQAQQQAQEAWNNYDQEALRQKITELGKSATIYIDEADRKLESLELGAVNYLQQRGNELVEKVKEVAVGEEHGGEVLYNGPEGTPISRLDAELMALNSAPDQILASAASASSSSKSYTKAETQELLSKNPDLDATYKSLVPAKLSDASFWNSYLSLRTKLEEQDNRRKQLIQNHEQEGNDQNELDDWGSSDDEDESTAKGHSDKPPKANNAAEKQDIKKNIEEEGSDSDWE